MSFTDKLKNKYKEYRYENLYPDLYKKACNSPVNSKKIIFLKLSEKKLYGSSKHLYEQLKKCDKYSMKTLCMQFNRSGGKAFHENMKKVVAELATARWIIIEEGNIFLSQLDIRPETKVLYLECGTGILRKLGDDGRKGAYEKGLPIYKNIDYVVTSGKEFVPFYVNEMKIAEEKVLPLGSCHSDLFFNEDFKKKSKEKFYSLLPEAEEKKIILYAPSYRGNRFNASSPRVFGEYKLIKERMGSEYMMVLHHHPYAKTVPLIKPKEGHFTKDLTDNMTVEEMICCADYLITDYSSVLFDFTLVDKPMAFLGYDYDKFQDRLYEEYPFFVPGPVCKNGYALTYRLKNDMELYDEEKINAFREKYLQACDGHATERVIDFLNDWIDK